jgi:hypothetical protein
LGISLGELIRKTLQGVLKRLPVVHQEHGHLWTLCRL